MATLVDEAMESYVYPSYNPYSYRYQSPKGKGGAGPWRQRGGYFSGYGETAAVAAAAAEYFDNYQRAQLKAILSQVNPNLTPRLRKANTKEVGVQVNPRQDASVQCSLGPRPLLLRRRAAGVPLEQEQGSPVSGSARPVRFPRTIAVYSPVASRRLTTFLEEPEPQEAGASPPAQQPREGDEDAVAAVRASWEKPEESPAEPREQRQPQAEDKEPPAAAPEVGEEEDKPPAKFQEEVPEEKREAEGGPQAAGKPAEEQQPQEDSGPSKTRVRFQFLEQKYGYYHCKDCNIRWESAYVWCVQGTNKVYFRQFCRTCQKSYNPYRVEDITCQSCKQTRCTCPVKLRHVDPKRPHRQDLCGRCKGKRLSCDSTFSFKYII
ncbi:zygote arrest protein 1 isoform X2 [Hemicordylus capensis]|uniref:zygote arrest protein 1 isoform X2 n=1 Tax=Hemicordylus capensis TaxID=884348 RepID=UPI0023020DE0|nr:zygote arrest protein 1 isoform X2 [Hemicordylus capensis]